MMQEERRKYDPATAEKIDEFLKKVRDMMEAKSLPFTFEVIDPSGNSFIQNPKAPQKDEHCTYEKIVRTKEMYEFMGYNAEEAMAHA